MMSLPDHQMSIHLETIPALDRRADMTTISRSAAECDNKIQ